MRSSPLDVITIRVDRGSVAMGDDVDSHEEFWDHPASATVDDLLVDIASGFVASVACDVGWVVHLMNGRRNAVETLGVIYRGQVDRSSTICRPARSAVSLVSLAAPVGIDVHVAYLPGARPLELAELRRSLTRSSRRIRRRATRDGAPDGPT